MKLPLFINVVLCGFMLSACGQKQSTHTDVQPASAASAVQSTQPVYRVATDATYPPFEFTNEQGDIIGLDIDLLNAIAKKQGFRVEYYHHGWDSLFNELKSNQADILASAIAITDEAKKDADLSSSYFASPYAVVALKPDNLQNNKWQKQTIAVGANEDTQDDLIAEYGISKDKFHRAETLYLGITNVLNGHADVVVGDATVMRYHINSPTFKEKHIHFTLQDLVSADPETDKLVFAVKKGNTELLAKIDAGLTELKQSGELDKILHKWLTHQE